MEPAEEGAQVEESAKRCVVARAGRPARPGSGDAWLQLGVAPRCHQVGDGPAAGPGPGRAWRHQSQTGPSDCWLVGGRRAWRHGPVAHAALRRVCSGLAPTGEVGAGKPEAAVAPAGHPIVVQSANDSYTIGTAARKQDVRALQAFFAYLLDQPPAVLPNPVEVGDAWTAVASLDLRVTACDDAEMGRLESVMQREAELTRIWRTAVRESDLSAEERARRREPENVARAVAHIYRQFNSGLSLRCTEGTPLADVDLAAFSVASLRHIYTTWSREDSALREGLPFLPSLDQFRAQGLAAGRQEFLVEGLVDPALHHAAQTGGACCACCRPEAGRGAGAAGTPHPPSPPTPQHPASTAFASTAA